MRGDLIYSKTDFHSIECLIQTGYFKNVRQLNQPTVGGYLGRYSCDVCVSLSAYIDTPAVQVRNVCKLGESDGTTSFIMELFSRNTRNHISPSMKTFIALMVTNWFDDWVNWVPLFPCYRPP